MKDFLSFSHFLKDFKNDPFGTLDNLNLRYIGFQFNILKNDEKLRKALFEIFFIIPLVCWVLLGSDSTVDQIEYAILNIPNFLLGKLDSNGLLQIYNSYYGLGTHWSAPVIYSLLFIGVSKHLHDKLDTKNSLNLSLTAGVVALTIAAFEFYWQFSYAVFQNQWWVLSLQPPELTIIMRNVLFAVAGFVVLFGLNWKEYKLNIDKITILSFLSTIGLVLLWWFYPFPTTQ